MRAEIIWMQIVGIVGIYCIIQAVRDARTGNYVWAAVAALSAAALLLTPINTHAVKFDLPADVTTN